MRRLPTVVAAVCFVATCFAILLTPAGCDKSSSSGGGGASGGSGSGTTKVIGVIPKGLTHVFWQSVKKGAEQAGDELKVQIKWDGPPNEKDINTQDRIIGDMVNRGVDALVVAPCDKTALVTSMAAAKKKMPVVVFDSGSDFKDYDAFVATDNYKGGQLAGEAMVKLLEGKTSVELALIRYGAGSASTLDRERGFIDVLKKARPDVKLYDEQFAGSTGDEAARLMSNLLQAHPNITAVYGSNESTTRGALGALEQARKLGDLRFVGFDSSPELVAALDKGQIQALVLQDPVKMGYLSVKAAVAALRGEKVAKEQPIAPTLVTQENKGQPAIQELLRPRLK